MSDLFTAKELKERIDVNDNRCTAKPYLLLLRELKTIVVDGDHSGVPRYIENYTGDYVTADTKQELIDIIRSWYGSDEEEYYWPDSRLEKKYEIRQFYVDEFEYTINVFLTDQGYQDHLKINKHNLPKHDTYGIHAFRNKEIKSLFALIDKCIQADEKISELKEVEKKWNCKHCRDAYERGGCPDHGPSIVEGLEND